MPRSSKRTIDTVTMLLDELLNIGAENETNDVARAVFDLMTRTSKKVPTDITLRLALLDSATKAHQQALTKPSGDVLAQDAACWIAHLRAGDCRDDGYEGEPPF